MSSSEDLVRRAQARVGATLVGKYRLDAVLGVGGMATVYAATHRRNTKRVAIKMLHPELANSHGIHAHFKREGYAANSVGHAGVVQVDDDDISEDGIAFIVMELLDGLSVEELRHRHRGRLPARHAATIVGQLLDVLAAAHARGVVHRDIKPANLFLIRDGTLKVLDFGIARVRHAAGFDVTQGTGPGELLGTPGFMAPEQALGCSEQINAQTDVWAASSTLFTLLTGQLVHSGRTPQELRVSAARDPAPPLETVAPDVPASFGPIVARGLALSQDARWESAAEMRQALNEAYKSAFGDEWRPVDATLWEPPVTFAAVDGAATTAPVGEELRPDDEVPKTATERPVTKGEVAVSKSGRRRAGPLLVLGGALATTLVGARWPTRPASSQVETDRAESSLLDGPRTPPRSAESGAPRFRADGTAALLSSPSSTPPLVADAEPQRSRDFGGLSSPQAVQPPRPALVRPSCTPPTTVDSAGVKHPKPWCL
ncbi:MAG: protein kinase [Polyangiaceae bacterium]|jgi:serine/threonine protein kinase